MMKEQKMKVVFSLIVSQVNLDILVREEQELEEQSDAQMSLQQSTTVFGRLRVTQKEEGRTYSE